MLRNSSSKIADDDKRHGEPKMFYVYKFRIIKDPIENIEIAQNILLLKIENKNIYFYFRSSIDSNQKIVKEDEGKLTISNALPKMILKGEIKIQKKDKKNYLKKILPPKKLKKL